MRKLFHMKSLMLFLLLLVLIGRVTVVQAADAGSYAAGTSRQSADPAEQNSSAGENSPVDENSSAGENSPTGKNSSAGENSPVDENSEDADKFLNLEDGEYACHVTLVGGSGKATVTDPCLFTVVDGQAFATLVWSSSHYDYMIVDGVKYLPVNEEGNSTFEIPIKVFDQELPIIADTTAMSTAHEVEYAITFYSDQIMDAKDTPMARARYSVYMAGVIILICMAESARKKYVKKQRMKSMR